MTPFYLYLNGIALKGAVRVITLRRLAPELNRTLFSDVCLHFRLTYATIPAVGSLRKDAQLCVVNIDRCLLLGRTMEFDRVCV